MEIMEIKCTEVCSKKIPWSRKIARFIGFNESNPYVTRKNGKNEQRCSFSVVRINELLENINVRQDLGSYRG